MTVLFMFAVLAGQAAASEPPQVELPPVDEAALTARLVEMARPARGERAIILYDPTYYPGITTRLRDALQALGVQTYVIVEDTPAMVRAYQNTPEPERRELDVIAALKPIFRASDIFYWMPVRGYADDLRWERLVAESEVRSVHFHWMIRFRPTSDEVVARSQAIERRALEVDLANHARRQARLAAALRGQTVRVTTPSGTNLTFAVPRDQWFHQGDGDASKAQIELPVGMFAFVPDAQSFEGTLVVPSVSQAGPRVKDATMRFRRGRAIVMTAAEGTDWFPAIVKEVGPDGDKIAALFINTNLIDSGGGIAVDVGSNWEIGGRNRANGMRSMSMRLEDATLTAGGRTLMRDGRVLWEEIP